MHYTKNVYDIKINRKHATYFLLMIKVKILFKYASFFPITFVV